MPLFERRPDIGKMKAKQDVEGLNQALNHKDAEIRLGAVQALIEIGNTQAIRVLTAAAQDGEEGVREAAAEYLRTREALRLLASLPSPPQFGKQFTYEQQRLIEQVEERLVHMGVPAVPVLIAALAHDNRTIQSCAIKALGAIGDVRAIEPLMAVYEKNKGNTRGGDAIDSLQQINDPRIVGLLLSILKTKETGNYFTRAYAVSALGRLGDVSAVESLITVLQDRDGFERRDTTASHVRDRAALALGELRDARALTPLITALKDEKDEIRWSAAEALGELGDAGAVDPLIAALQDESSLVRKYAARSLCKLGSAQGTEVVLADLHSDDRTTREEAALFLCEVGNAEGIAETISILNTIDGFFLTAHSVTASGVDKKRLNALHVLSKLGDHPQAIEAITAILNDENSVMREAAAQVLQRMTGSAE